MTESGGSTSRRDALRAVALVAILAVVVVGLVALTADRWTGRAAVRRARADVEALGFSRASLVQAFPEVREPNAAAARLQQLASPLDIPLFGKAPARGRSSEAELRRRDAREWVRGSLAQPGEEITAPPSALAAWLAAHEPEMTALADELRAGGDARWPQRLEWDAPMPNLLGQLDLTRLFLAQAFIARRAGDDAAAQRWIEAAWRASDLLQPRGEMISHLIHLAGTQWCAASLRKLDRAPPELRARLDIEPYRENAWRVNARDAHAILDQAEGDVAASFDQGASWLARLAAPRLRRAAVTAALDRVKLAQAAQQPARCGPDTIPLPLKVEEPANGGFPGLFGDGWLVSGGELARLDILRLHFELTDRVAALKEARAATGAWPAELPGGESSACPGARFRLWFPAADVARIEIETFQGPWWERVQTQPATALAWQSAPPSAPTSAPPN